MATSKVSDGPDSGLGASTLSRGPDSGLGALVSSVGPWRRPDGMFASVRRAHASSGVIFEMASAV